MSLTAEIFGQQSVPFVSTIRYIIPQLKGSANIYHSSVVEFVGKSSVASGLSLHWHEILGRAYVAAAASLIRHEQWISASETCYQKHSYLGFCACIRGLLESTADSMYTLRYFAPTVAPVWNAVKKLLRGEQLDTLPRCDPTFEAALIHFAFAKNFKKGEEVPDAHKALQNRAYINVIREADSNLESLYCALVELVHPAKASVDWMLLYEAQDTHWTVSFNSGEEASIAICDMLDTYRDPLFGLTSLACNYSLLTLKCLREMNLEEMNLSFMDEIDLNDLPAWRQFVNQTQK
jgi:hypothetical protein